MAPVADPRAAAHELAQEAKQLSHKVTAEVARVVALGATVVEEKEGYTTLADPGGLLFCVVPLQTRRADFDEHATRWATQRHSR